MKEERLLKIIHELRNDADCTDKELCDAVNAVNQSMNIESIAELTHQPAEIGDDTIVKFTKKEINDMPSTIREKFLYKGLVAHIRRRNNGSIDVYLNIDGKRYQGTAQHLDIAKAKFIASLNGAGQKRGKKKVVSYAMEAIKKIKEEEENEILIKAKTEAVLRTKDPDVMRAILLAETKHDVEQIIGFKIVNDINTFEEDEEKNTIKSTNPQKVESSTGKKVGRPRKSGLFDDIQLSKKTPLKDYFLKWLNLVKKPYIKETTYKTYLDQYKSGMSDYFEGVMIEDCDGFFLQKFINSYTEVGHNRTAQKLYNLIKPCLEYAVADGVIDRNPMAKVSLPKFDKEIGKPITREEEKILLESLKARREPRTQALVFLLYTGIRVGELPTAIIRGNFVICNTSKLRKGLSEKKRKIPISPNLKRYMPYIDLQRIKPLSRDSICRRMNKICPGHHTHDLRHTFITRAQEVGIRREIVSLWAGHAPDTSMTSTVYTHLEQNEELQLEEIKKFDYKL